MMRKTATILILTCLLATAAAQSAKDEIASNLRLSASNFMAYMAPQKPLTAAPEGMKPFYISHYGRHGSRFLTNANEYDYPFNALRHADSLGKLTPLGKNVLSRLQIIRQEAQGRLGDLTPLGAEQQKQIARRMYERFPQVFTDEATIDAKSTIVVRCILSMENALQQLLILNPRLTIAHDASQHDMYYMNQDDPELWPQKTEMLSAVPFQEFCNRHDRSLPLLQRLVNDTAYISQSMNPTRFTYSFFKVASNIQNTELILEADSCIALKHPSASLRFGHETVILPLTCLLNLNNYGEQITDLEQLERKGWRNYRIFPMAANIQFVFYRRHQRDTDVMFKVLLNEEEASLPLKTSTFPYYRWRDFREYFLKLLDGYGK